MSFAARRLIIFIGTAFVTIIFMGVSEVAAQRDVRTMRVETNLVLIDVLVMDKTGRPVKGIAADKFELFVDNKKQTVDGFYTEESPVAFGIIFDMHPTTADRNKVVIDSLREFRNRSPSDNDVFLASFNMSGLQIFDFIPTVEQLERHMTEPATRKVRSLYDAVDFASDRIQTSRHRKRVLLIISDSADHNSKNSLSQLRSKLMRVQTEVYAIMISPAGHFGYADITHNHQNRAPYSPDASPLDRAALSELAAKTGGATFFSGSESTAHLLNIYQQIAVEMRSHYTLGFYPDVIDRAPHRIRVKLRDVAGIKDMVLTYRNVYQSRPN